MRYGNEELKGEFAVCKFTYPITERVYEYTLDNLINAKTGKIIKHMVNENDLLSMRRAAFLRRKFGQRFARIAKKNLLNID